MNYEFSLFPSFLSAFFEVKSDTWLLIVSQAFRLSDLGVLS